MLWIIALIAAWYGFGWLRMIFYRARLALRLKRFCKQNKLRLKWVRPVIASLFVGRGKIDFTVDDRIHVAVLSTPRRRCTCRLTDDAMVMVRIMQRYTSVSGRARLHRQNDLKLYGRFRHRLNQLTLPADAAKVAIVHPVPYDVEVCRGSQTRSVNSGEALPGGFQFNTQSHFFARLEEYAKTGDMAVWAARKVG